MQELLWSHFCTFDIYIHHLAYSYVQLFSNRLYKREISQISWNRRRELKLEHKFRSEKITRLHLNAETTE